MRLLLILAALVSASLSVSRAAYAWSDDGYRIVALIADHYLTPPARSAVEKLLKSDPTQGAADLPSAAISLRKAGITADWQFAEIKAGRPNIPEACSGHPSLPAGSLASQGPAKACVIDKIDQFAAELGDPRVNGAERLLALKYLTVLVADIHQPLRVAEEGNHHGQGLPVTAAAMTPGNLFDFWESTLISRLEEGFSPNDVARLLVSRISESDLQLWGSRAPQLWALESYQLGVDRAYGMINTYDDQGRGALQPREIELALQTTALQLSRAGVRLAYVLNQALTPANQVTPITVRVRTGNATNGKLFAQGPCAVCHVVVPGQVGAQSMAPDFATIAKTAGVTESALVEFLGGPHPSMPNIRLSQKQTEDLVAYITSLR